MKKIRLISALRSIRLNGVLLFLAIGMSGLAQSGRDYRLFQSPVKNQANRGTCTAFSILAAMETLPGFPVDLSEQYVYAQVKLNHYEEYAEYGEGAMLKYYIRILESDGTVREDLAPYNPDAPIWREEQSNFDKMKKDLGGTPIANLLAIPDYTYQLSKTMYQYRDFDNARDVEWIKKKLDEGYPAIPVAYKMNGRYWSQHAGLAKKKIDLDDFLLVKYQDRYYPYSAALNMIPDLPAKIMTDKVQVGFSDTLLIPDGGHAVCITGYDENGFLIKNSWGEAWGDKGYGWISFNYHRLLALEALLLVSGKINGDPKKEPLSPGPGNIWLKSRPVLLKANDVAGTPEQLAMSFSVTYHGTGMVPRFESIEYKIYDDLGRLVDTYFGRTKGVYEGVYDGYETFVLLKENTSPGKKFTVKATFKPVLLKPFTNTYEFVEKVTKEYEPGR